MKNLALILIVAVTIASCQPSAEQIQKAIEETQIAQAVLATNTLLPSPTKTVGPTNTPKPTRTPAPTRTRRPTPTPTIIPTSTAVPQPVEFSGIGDEVIDFDNPFGPSFAHITYTGGGNFAVWNVDRDNENINLLVNVIGGYDGYLPIDLLDSEKTKRFRVESSGPWEITIYPLALEYLRFCDIPGTCEGKGDDVRIFRGSHPDIAKVVHKGESNFAIWTFGERSRDLAINEIGSYEGTILLGSDVFAIVIEADGDWTLEITGR